VGILERHYKVRLVNDRIIEKQIIDKLRGRDEGGIALLYSHYTNALFGIAMRVLSHEAFAEDALQKSYLKIWNNIDQYSEHQATLYTWMAQIVRNTAIDIRRLKSFQAEAKSDTYNPIVHIGETTKIDTDKLDVQKAITSLDEKYAFVLEYLYLRGYSQSELADEFDMPLGTIKSRVKKAINILRTHLKGDKEVLYSLVIILLLLLLKLL